jgi:hypothetical protein
MYQHELFMEQSKKNAVFLGQGLFSIAHRLSNGLVCKTGVNDMTRNWLEFCMIEREAGRLLPGMPEVYQVVALGEHSYSAIMEEYLHWPTSGVPICGAADVGLQQALEPLFSDYLKTVLGASGYNVTNPFNDLHSGNVMYSHSRGWVITDPSASDYKVMQGRTELELH